MISVNDPPVIRHQSLSVEALQRCGPGAVLHLLQGSRGAERISYLASRFESGAQLRDNEAVMRRHRNADDAELIYYTRCLGLLVCLAKATARDTSSTSPTWRRSSRPSRRSCS